ncbi:MAG: DUF2059 domain-containing protein [Stenotrophobium sp.]
MKKTLMVLLALAGSTAWAAGTPHAGAKGVERLLEVSHAENMSAQMQAQIQASLNQQAQQMQLTDAQRPIVDKYTKEISDLILPELAWSKFEPDLVKIYSETFTDKEISDLTKFYETETGQSYLKKSLALNQKIALLTQSRMRPLMPRIQDISRRMDAELAAQKKAAVPKK